MLPAEFDWDEYNLSHIADHGVTPREVEEAARDPRRVPVAARRVAAERRYALVGATDAGRILFVAYTRRHSMVRVVTAY